MVEALPEAPQGQVIGPVLGGDGVAVADDGPVLRGGQQVHIAEEIVQVGGPGGLHGDVGGLGLIAVGVEAAAQGAAGVDHAPHEGEVPQVEAHLDHLTGSDRQLQGIGNDSLPRADGHRPLAAEINGVKLTGVEGGGLGQGDGLGAAVIVKGQPDGRAGKGHVDAIADGDVFGVPLGAVFGNGYGVAPDTGPVLIVHGDSPSFVCPYHTTKMPKLEPFSAYFFPCVYS